jgi:hypothetical protein
VSDKKYSAKKPLPMYSSLNSLCRVLLALGKAFDFGSGMPTLTHIREIWNFPLSEVGLNTLPSF